jgi:hypothetical protein
MFLAFFPSLGRRPFAGAVLRGGARFLKTHPDFIYEHKS